MKTAEDFAAELAEPREFAPWDVDLIGKRYDTHTPDYAKLCRLSEVTAVGHIYLRDQGAYRATVGMDLVFQEALQTLNKQEFETLIETLTTVKKLTHTPETRRWARKPNP